MALAQDLYLISVAARMLGMHPQTLRKYERLGLVQPPRTLGSMRVYTRAGTRTAPHDQASGRRGRASTWPACSGCCRWPRSSSACGPCSTTSTWAAPTRASTWLGKSRRSAGSWGSDAMEFKDYYQTLGLSKTASDKEIKSTYRKLARKHHPDVNPGDKAAEAKFKEINEAYEVLGDPEKRKKYDELGANWRMYEQGGHARRRRLRPRRVVGEHGRRPRRLPHDERRRDAGDVRNGEPVLGLLQHVLRRRRSRRGAAAARWPRPQPEGPRPRARDHYLTRGRVQGVTRRLALKHDGQRARRRADSRRHRRRLPGAGERAKASRRWWRHGRRLVSPDSARAAWHVRAQGTRPYTRVAVPLTVAVLGGEVDVPALGGRTLRLKVPAGHAERPDLPAARTGHGAGRQSRRTRRPLRHGGRAVAAAVTPEQRDHYEALAKTGV